jgi:hypothetical protein
VNFTCWAFTRLPQQSSTSGVKSHFVLNIFVFLVAMKIQGFFK